VSLSAINFPWIGRNPFRLAGITWLFVFALSSPLMVLAGISHHWLMVPVPFLFATVMGLISLLVALVVRSMMDRLQSRAPQPQPDDEFRSDCLMVKGMFQTPGIVVVREDRVVLTPVFGGTVDLPFSEVRSASEVQWFNGELLMGRAKGFWLAVPGFWRLGLAVDEPGPLRSILERHSVRFAEATGDDSRRTVPQ
jgi:hypothetical protein